MPRMIRGLLIGLAKNCVVAICSHL